VEMSLQSVEALLGEVPELNSRRDGEPPAERTDREEVCEDTARDERCDGDQGHDGNLIHQLKDTRHPHLGPGQACFYSIGPRMTKPITVRAATAKPIRATANTRARWDTNGFLR